MQLLIPGIKGTLGTYVHKYGPFDWVIFSYIHKYGFFFFLCLFAQSVFFSGVGLAAKFM